MKIAIIGRGLIGGSFEKAALRAGHEVIAFDRGESPQVADADVVLIAVPPSAVLSVLQSFIGGPGKAIVVDATGIKGEICAAVAKLFAETTTDFVFVGGHPMAGKERTGYANSCAELFDGASMILTPFPGCPPAVVEKLEPLFASLGFARTVITDPRHHDEMIAFTSQLCHLISSAYVREPLAREHVGYSAGSFKDMVRVGAPDPAIWTELFLANRQELMPVLARYIERMQNFQAALQAEDGEALRSQLQEGVIAKQLFGKDLK